MDAERHFGIGDIAAQFLVCPETIRNWERQGKLPPVARTLGRHRRYTRVHLDAIHALLKPVTAPAQPEVAVHA